MAMALLARQTQPEQQKPIRAGTQLVVLPTSVTDQHGRPIEGLSSADFIVLDSGKRRPVQVDTEESGLAPIALVTLIQTSDISLSALGKIRKVGTMIPDAVVGANGESAVVTFDSQVKLLCDFTPDADAISRAFEDLKPADNNGGRMIDAVDESLRMLAKRRQDTRAIIVIVGESRDRGSEGKLADLLAKLRNRGVAIYSLTYSAYLTPFTTKADEYTPPPSRGGLLEAITETARLAKQNTVKELTEATGGWRLSFQTKSKLENDLIRLGGEIHRRYYLSFTPQNEALGYHSLEVQIKGHPEAVVRTRPGYWAGRVD
jgi:VWFA-related protein